MSEQAILEVSNWLVYVLRGEHGLLAVGCDIQVFTSTGRAKEFRAARDDRAGFQLEPRLLNDVKELAAERHMGVAINPALAAGALDTSGVSGC